MADKPPHHLSIETQEALTSALSAVADGQASSEQLALVMQAWRTDADLRAQWADFQLVAQALRHPEQTMLGGSSDETFLNDLRTRMAQEPVVLAPALWPAPVTASAGAGKGDQMHGKSARGMQWLGPAAMAACFVFLMSGLVSFIRSNDAAGLQGNVQIAAGGAETERTMAGAEAPHWPLETAWSTPAGFVPVATGSVRPEATYSAYAITGTEPEDSAVMMPASLSRALP